MFIFTEMVGVPEVGEVMLKSYLRYHTDPIHVYCTVTDKTYLEKTISSGLIKYIIVSDRVVQGYKTGHDGTAEIYGDVLTNTALENIIHIDSDVVFKKESLSIIKDKLNEGYALVGPIRRYKDNPNNCPEVEYRENVVSTYFFGFKKSFITSRPRKQLIRMARGASIDGEPVLDFFDPVSFDILNNGGKVYYIPQKFAGGLSITGHIKNIGNFINEDLDYGENLIHFAGVASGFIRHHNKAPKVHSGYASWALTRYYMFSNLFSIEKESFTLPDDKTKLYHKLSNEFKNLT